MHAGGSWAWAGSVHAGPARAGPWAAPGWAAGAGPVAAVTVLSRGSAAAAGGGFLPLGGRAAVAIPRRLAVPGPVQWGT